MPYLLNACYLFVLLLLSPWLLYKALTTGKYRRGMWRKITGLAPRRVGTTPCAWFHGVSVGEIHLLRQVIAEFQRQHPDWECVLSTTTDTGFDEARKRFPDLTVFFWPLDFTWATGRALRRINPSIVILAEGEVWPNFLAAARRRGAPVAQINGRMSPRSFRRYRRAPLLGRWLFGELALIAAQTEEYAASYRALGAVPERVFVTGSVKYDGVETERDNRRTLEMRRLLAIQKMDLVLVAGSTQAPEEQLIVDLFRQARERHENLRLVVVPRQKERFGEVANLLRRCGMRFVRRSELSQPLNDRQAVILVDTIGELGAIWGLADVAFVGGSLDGKRGGQNMIEPAAYGAAVIFGPHVWNFKDPVRQLLERRAAVQVADAATLAAEVSRLLGDPVARSALGSAARQFVLAQRGATAHTVAALSDLLHFSSHNKRAA